MSVLFLLQTRSRGILNQSLGVFLLIVTGVPHQHNSYAEHAVFQLLEPVVDSSQGLPEDSQLNVLTLVIDTMMEAWSDWILKQEIVFR